MSFNNIHPDCSSTFRSASAITVISYCVHTAAGWSSSALSAAIAQVLSSFVAKGVMWIVKRSLLLTLWAVFSHTSQCALHAQTNKKICGNNVHVALCVFCCFLTSYHEVRLSKDPPELLGLHVLWVTRDGFQYLLRRKGRIREVTISAMFIINNTDNSVSISVHYLLDLPTKLFE